jgi:hypothetical protein
MTLPEHDVESFVDALRADVPSAHDDVRIRARLAALGVVAGTAVAAPSAAFGASSVSPVAQTGLWSKLAALSWTSKVGLATAVVAASTAAPVAVHYARSAATAPSGRSADISPARDESRRALTRGQAPRVAAPVVLPDPMNEPSVAATSSPVSRAPVREPSRAPVVGSPSVAVPAPSAAGAFPAAPSHGTLREETELIERALAAVRAGDRATALGVLQDHARRFPNGLLARERERALDRIYGTSNAGQ